MNEDPFSSSAEARLSGFFAWIKSNAISITLVLVLLIASFFIYLYFQNKKEERLSEAFEAYQNDLAKGKLTKVITNAVNSNNPLHDIAVIRLGYILIQERNFDEAKKNLAPRLDFYEPKRLELLGDIASFEESYEAANTYYEEAIKATGDQGFIELMNIKLSLLPSS